MVFPSYNIRMMQDEQAPASGDPIRVAIVEDDPDFSRALTLVVGNAPDMVLTGQAATQAEGLAMLAGPAADVLLVDLGLPDGSGIAVIASAVQQWPRCSIMVSTNFGDETHVMRSIEAGATGYLLKDSSPSKMGDEIRSLAGGGSPISPIIARKILARFRSPPGPEEASPLSQREKEVLVYITKGFTVHEIAGLLDLSHFTVRTFVRRIYSKLNVSSKAEAIFEARNQGLLR